MDFFDDGLEDEIILQADDPPSSTSDLEPVSSPTATLPTMDLAFESQIETGMGKHCKDGYVSTKSHPPHQLPPH